VCLACLLPILPISSVWPLYHLFSFSVLPGQSSNNSWQAASLSELDTCWYWLLLICPLWVILTALELPTMKGSLSWYLAPVVKFILFQNSFWCELDRLCGLVVRVSGYRSRGPSLILGATRFLWEVVGLERGPLSLVSTTEELLERKSSGSGLEIREYGCRDPSCWPRGALYP
jgi:hypothetical protein